MKVSINIPSYKRPKVKTLSYIPYARVWVAESEADEYKKENPGAEIVSMPDQVQGNIARVRNYILDHCDDDAVCIMDDDYSGLFYWENKKKHLVTAEMMIPFIKKYTIVAKEWGSRMWGVNVNDDKQVYRTFLPFSTINFVGAPFGVFLPENELRYDERLPLKEDYDMTLQQLNKYRVLLRLNKFFYEVKQSEQTGGCAQMRNFHKEMQQVNLLKKKWGSDIVKFDHNNRSHNLKKKKEKFDFNPLIKVPIKGV